MLTDLNRQGLFKNNYKVSLIIKIIIKTPPNLCLQTMKRIELQAGFVEFCRQNFEEATTHFNNGGLDPREVCSN